MNDASIIRELNLDFNGAAPPARLDEYFGPWAFEEQRFLRMVDGVNRMDLRRHVEDHRAQQPPGAAANSAVAKQINVQNRQAGALHAIEQIELKGTLMKQVGSLADGTSTISAKKRIRDAAANADIDGILLVIDSPGGTVAGTMELAEAIADANRQKPVFALIEDLGASAAYWLASQAEKIYANTPTTMVGSIGVLLVLYDMSGMAEKEGIEAVVLKTGKFKGTGVPGAAISDEERENLQSHVEAIQEHFTAGVARGRGLEKSAINGLEANIFVAAEAQALGLIDGIENYENTVKRLSQAIAARRASAAGARGRADIATDTTEDTHNESGHQAAARAADETTADTETPAPQAPNDTEVSMSQTTDATENRAADKATPQAASYEEIVGACIGIDDSKAEDQGFILDQIKHKRTVDEARVNWMETQTARTEAARKDLESAQEKAEASTRRPGVQPVGSGNVAQAETVADDPIRAYQAELNRLMKEESMSRAEAAREIAVNQPELNQAYLDDYKQKAAAGQLPKQRRRVSMN